MWWLLSQHFGLRGCQEHYTINVEDFTLNKAEGHSLPLKGLLSRIKKRFGNQLTYKEKKFTARIVIAQSFPSNSYA